MRRLACVLSAGIAAAVLSTPAAPSARQPHDLETLLRQAARLSAAEIAAVRQGQPVARVLDTERTEVAVAGAVHIRAARDRILDRYRDVSLLAKSNVVVQVGRFGVPPRTEDLRDLVFEEYDLQALQECEPGDCAVRLTAAMMSQFQQRVTWQAADWRAQAAALWRELLAGYAAEYRERGDAALAEYHNKEAPLRLQDQFAILYRESDFVTPFAPELLPYLQKYPRLPLPATEDILYWSKENFGLKPVLTITHLSIHGAPADGPGGAALVGAKQIYATHYFDAALGITVALDDGNGGSYMVVINRARTRSLTSRFRGFVRSIVQGRGRDAVEKLLRSTKASLERPR